MNNSTDKLNTIDELKQRFIATQQILRTPPILPDEGAHEILANQAVIMDALVLLLAAAESPPPTLFDCVVQRAEVDSK